MRELVRVVGAGWMGGWAVVDRAGVQGRGCSAGVDGVVEGGGREWWTVSGGR